MVLQAWTSRTPIGLDVGAWAIKAVQLRGMGSGPKVLAAAHLPRRTVGAALGSEEVDRLRSLLARKGFVGTQVVVAVPHADVLGGLIELPPIDGQAHLADLARGEFSRMYGRAPGTFEMTYWPLPAPPEKRGATPVLALSCAHTAAEELLDTFESAGMAVLALDTNTCALARACGDVLAGSQGIWGILDLGWSACRLILMYQGVVVYQGMVPEAGIESLLASLREDWDGTDDDLVALLPNIGPLAKPARADPQDPFAALRRRIWVHFEEVASDLQAPFAYVARQYAGAHLDGALLVGGAAGMPGLAECLSSVLSLSVRGLSLDDLADGGGDLSPHSRTPAFVAAAGVAQFREKP